MNKIFLTLVLIITASIHISCPQKLRPEEKAIRLVEESRALGGELSVGLTIDKWLKERGEEVRPIGWSVSKKNDQVYSVSYKYRVYSLREGAGERGFFFEVNLPTKAVRNLTEEVTRKMDSLAPPFNNEEEISEQLMQRLGEKEKMLSGGEL